MDGLRPVLVVAALLLAACGGEEPAPEPATEGGALGERDDVRAVPDEYDTIQAAVDAAGSGDLVLIAPGTYHEEVTVRTADIVIRGLDRNDVVLDGDFELEHGIQVLDADGVAIENLTARNYLGNGFFWSGVARYRGSYLTAHNNGSYGIYAFDSTDGWFEHSYASGHPDAGFYIGQCNPCRAVVDDVVAEFNRSGYSGTNAGGDLFIVGSTFRNNHNGIVPNTSSYELYAPERATTIVGNLVHSNSLDEFLITPGDGVDTILHAGNGILVLGGVDNVIERNRVVTHDKTGIGVVLTVEPTFEDGRLSGEREWWSTGNEVRGNAVADSGWADLAVFDRPGDGNCFEGNDHRTSAPARIEELLPCAAGGAGSSTEGALDRSVLETIPAEVDRDAARDRPAPEPQESMPDAGSAPWEPAGSPPALDLAEIELPPEP